MSSKQILALTVASFLAVAAGLLWLVSVPRSDFEKVKHGDEGVVLDAESAEMTAFMFMQDVMVLLSGTDDPLVVQRLYGSLSKEAKMRTSLETISLDIATFSGIERVPEQGISVEDLEIGGEAKVTLVVGLNYASGRTLRAVHLVAEEGRWKVDSIVVRDVSALEPPSDPVPSEKPEPGIGQEPAPVEPDEPIVRGECQRGGCSGQMCTDDPSVMTTCEWREEYACYRDATCERQANGVCGWTKTTELAECLANARDTR